MVTFGSILSCFNSIAFIEDFARAEKHCDWKSGSSIANMNTDRKDGAPQLFTELDQTMQHERFMN
jgi:hypothetical protein